MFSSNQQKLFRCLHNYQVVHHKFIRHEKCLDVDRATTHFFVLSQPESIFLNWRFSAALRSHDFFLSFALLFIHKISDIQHLNFYVIFINNNFRLEAIKLRQWIMELLVVKQMETKMYVYILSLTWHASIWQTLFCIFCSFRFHSFLRIWKMHSFRSEITWK